MSLSEKIRLGLESLFSSVGIDATFNTKSQKSDFFPFDRNSLESFFTKDNKITSYYDGIQKANAVWTDNLSKQFRFYSLQQLLEMVLSKEIDGDVAECGCWKGHSSYLIGKMIDQKNKTFHIFDSFEGGLSKKNENDKNLRFDLSEIEDEKEKVLFSSTEKEVRKILSDFEFVEIHKGWIPEHFKDVENKTFAFVHVDVDLYQPTYDSFKFFYERLSKGGVIVCDDYGLSQFGGCKKAVDKFLEETDVGFFYQVPSGGCFVMK